MTHRPHPLAAALLLTSALAGLSGCATPNLGPAPGPKPPAAYAAERSLAAPATEWPDDRWWRAYGDVDLDALIDEALAASPDLAAAEARVRKANALAEQARGQTLPRLDAAAQATWIKQSANDGLSPAFVPSGWNDTGKTALTLGYDLDLWGKTRATLAAAGKEAEAAEADRDAARLTLSTAVAAAWADFARLYADRDAAEADVRIRQGTRELISQRAGAGLETEAAVQRALAAEAAAKQELASTNEQIGLERDRIAALLGAGPDRGLALPRPGAQALRAFGLPADLHAGLIGRRPDVVAARLRAEAAAQRIKAAKADFYPDITLSAVIGQQSFGLADLFKAGSGWGAIGPAISLPIFTGGRIEGAYRGARADYDAAVASYDGSLTRAFQDVADVAVSERALGERLAEARAALDASDRARRLTSDRYRQGLAAYLDVLTAEDALVANRRAVADLETRAFALDVALVRALGGGFHSSNA